MANPVGNVLKVNFVQGPDYLQDVKVSVAEAANSAAKAATSANNAASYANQASAYKNQAQTYANNAASSATQASSYMTQAQSYATSAFNSANASANSATQAQGYRDEAKAYGDDTKAHYNQFYIDLTNIRNDFYNDLSDFKNNTNIRFNAVSNEINDIDEWIDQHNGAFSLYSIGLLDNDGNAIVDNDGEGFGSKAYLPITDPSLTQEGVPADAYSVGLQVGKLARLDAIIESWRDNFVTTLAPITDNDGNPVLDNDGEELTNGKAQLITDDTLTFSGVPADAYAVGIALQEIRGLIASYHP